MIHYELSQLQDHPEWLELLRAYSLTPPNEEGWSARIHAVEGVAEEHISRIHGKLIAFGFLDFQLADRHDGVFYRLTSLGNQGLIRLRSGANAADEEDETDEDTDCESDLDCEVDSGVESAEDACEENEADEAAVAAPA